MLVKRKFVVEVDINVDDEYEDSGTAAEEFPQVHQTLRDTFGVDPSNVQSMRVQQLSPLELNPGKYESQSGNFYFSCDTGSGVLVGTTQRNPHTGEPYSTCPILGLSLIYDLTTLQPGDDWPTVLLRLGEMITRPLPRSKSNDNGDQTQTQTQTQTQNVYNAHFPRASTPGIDEGSGIGFITTREWNELSTYQDQGENIFPRREREINEWSQDPIQGDWICILQSEVGIYELHTQME